MPCYFHLQPPDDVEDDLAEDIPAVEQPSQAVPTRGPSIQVSPPAPVTSTAPSPADLAGSSSTSPPPPQFIPISPQDFLSIMDAVRTFSATSASFAAAQASLAERMARTETALAQTSTLFQQN